MSNAEADSWLPVRPLAHQINSKHLLSEANNAVTAAKYFNTLYEQVNKREKKIKFDDDRAFVQDGFDTALDLLGTATTVAYFGQKLSDVNPLLMNDLTTWVSEGFWPMLAGSPRWLYPRPYKARDRLIQNIRELAKDVESDPTITSPFFAAKFKEEREFGLSNETVVKDLLSVLFGYGLRLSPFYPQLTTTNSVTANSVPTAYVGLLRILTTPGLVKGLRAELAAANFSTTAPDHHTTTFPAAFPLLRSVFWETLRVHNTSGTIREVIVPTEFESSSGETYSFKTGGVVTFQSGLLHMDPKIHPDPTAFRPQRFMIKELGGEGEDEKKTLKPFGGGVSYCPGRIFAEKQIMAYWAVLIWRFEMEIVNNEGKEKWQFPNNSDFYDVAKSKRATICFRMRDGC